MSADKILKGLKQAASGDLGRVTKIKVSDNRVVAQCTHGLGPGCSECAMEQVTGPTDIPLPVTSITAEKIAVSKAALSVFGAPEWSELDQDGQEWVRAIVAETLRRSRACDPAAGITPEELERLKQGLRVLSQFAPEFYGQRVAAKAASDIASRIVLAEPLTVTDETETIMAEALRVQEALNDANFEYDALAAAIGDLAHFLQQISPNEQSLAEAYHKAAGLKRRADTWRKSALTPTKEG